MRYKIIIMFIYSKFPLYSILNKKRIKTISIVSQAFMVPLAVVAFGFLDSLLL